MKLRFEGKDHTEKFRQPDMQRCRFECACACTGILFFIPLVSVPESRYGRYWANQGLIILFIELLCLLLGVLCGLLFGLLGMIPIVGILFTVLGKLVAAVLWCAVAFYIIYPMINAVRGQAKDIPFIGFIRIIR